VKTLLPCIPESGYGRDVKFLLESPFQDELTTLYENLRGEWGNNWPSAGTRGEKEGSTKGGGKSIRS